MLPDGRKVYGINMPSKPSAFPVTGQKSMMPKYHKRYITSVCGLAYNYIHLVF